VLEAHRPPNYGEFDPNRALRAAIAGVRHRVNILESKRFISVGDLGKVVAAVRMLLDTAKLEFDASLSCAMGTLADGTPSLSLRIDGPGRFPELLKLDGAIELPFTALSSAWTAATRGGRIDRVPSGLDLRLHGVRALPNSEPRVQPLHGMVSQAEERLRMLEAGESGVPAETLIAEANQFLQKALAVLDEDNAPRGATDIAAALRDAVSIDKRQLEEFSILYEMDCAPGIPPVVASRKALLAFFGNALKHTRTVLEHGGRISILVEYDRAPREVCILLAGEGLVSVQSATPMISYMRHCTVELHKGRFEYEATRDEFCLTARFPDSVGLRLDEWIPGFDQFSPNSVQMLRLLKSGGPTPPEDFILQGVLEDELERLLLPFLGVAPATHLAADLRPGERMLSGSSIERQSKVVGQISRGKAKKEICRPPYAGELIWMFAKDQRHRAAIGLASVSEDVLRELSEALLMTPMDHVLGLRVLAEVYSGRETPTHT